MACTGAHPDEACSEWRSNGIASAPGKSTHQMADQNPDTDHYPPGTSKRNKIEHRLFSFISLNWRGQPSINMRPSLI